jgi:acyl dehydratase
MVKNHTKLSKKSDTFKNFKINQKFNHYPGKTITEGEASLFTLMTMNHHPIHIDNEYAKKTKFKKNVVVGTYLISLAAGMSVRDITINSEAALEYKDIKHHYPAFIGDTVHAVSEITDKIIKKNGKGILFFKTYLYNQKNIKLISMSRANLFLLK